ncbi:MAG TPA: chromate resistance protein ChrB domain-containing protein [Pyrinomonadaceae bacterium]|nr:chromate resistance protein ChrB domain-containing protein [Pyrinomonadaceae bacterium]
MLQTKQVRNASSHEWILLIHQLPPKPTNLRVRIWRKLQKLGAVAIKNSVYVLPANDKTNEDFQWLKQEIDSAGGEAVVFRGGSVEGATDDEIIGAFRKARDEEFAAITAEFDGLTGRIREQSRAKHLSLARLSAQETELNRLHGELGRVIANDFFEANGRAAALTAYERCQRGIRRSQLPVKKTAYAPRESGALSVADFQNRRWATRRNLHIDRLASAWLISQFIDKRPRFYFAGDDETIDGAIPFDMFGAEFTHQGEDCTFETLLKRFGLTNIPGLSELAQIVHDIDLKDDKFNRLEAVGLNAIINGMSESLHDDRKLLQQSGAIFDGLFTLFGKQVDNKESRKSKHVSSRRTSPKK